VPSYRQKHADRLRARDAVQRRQDQPHDALAEHEIADRGRRRIERHLAEARLLVGKTLDSFDFEVVPMVSKAQVMALTAGDSWLQKGANLLLFGPPGGGKSHLAAAIGLALVENGWRVLFMRTSDLVQRLQIARRELALESALAKLDKYHLLILDDIVYVSKDQAETSVLFELIGNRYERRSMLITANQPFGEWGKVFSIDRLDRKSHKNGAVRAVGGTPGERSGQPPSGPGPPEDLSGRGASGHPARRRRSQSAGRIGREGKRPVQRARQRRAEPNACLPLRNFLYGDRHYLVADSLNPKARGFRLFSLANIEKVETTARPFTRRQRFSLQKFAEHSFGVFQEERFDVVWRFSPKAAPDARQFLFHPTQIFEEQPDGSLIVRFRAGGALEMCWHLFTWGGEVEVLSPTRLNKLFQERIIKARPRSRWRTPSAKRLSKRVEV
jgi:DNA replication protein DnaC